MLAIFSLCWWFFNVLNRSPTSWTFHEHILSPTSVTNIYVTEFLWAVKIKGCLQLKFWAFERDGKYVFPIIIMFTPLPFFWALFDMQGSRWTLTATQMNGWQGGDTFKVLPDQVQIMNPIMILLFLPLFQKIIYPAFEWCGIKVRDLITKSPEPDQKWCVDP